MRIAVEAILELRYKLRMMGIDIKEMSNILSDNEAVIINTQFPSSNLKKKRNAVAYHKCREAVC
jgi:predicted Ser/Thr protein kinase